MVVLGEGGTGLVTVLVRGQEAVHAASDTVQKPGAHSCYPPRQKYQDSVLLEFELRDVPSSPQVYRRNIGFPPR